MLFRSRVECRLSKFQQNPRAENLYIWVKRTPSITSLSHFFAGFGAVYFLKTFTMDCWRLVNSTVELNLTSYNNVPCGNTTSSTVVPCCASGDVCQYTHAPYGGDQSGYYVAGCTDKSLHNRACSQLCSEPPTDLVCSKSITIADNVF